MFAAAPLKLLVSDANMVDASRSAGGRGEERRSAGSRQEGLFPDQLVIRKEGSGRLLSQ